MRMNYSTSLRSAMGELTVHLTITGQRQQRALVWLGVQCIRLGCYIMGVKLDLSGLEREAKKVQP